MQPFLLLGDITGALVLLGLVVLVFGGLVGFIGVRLLSVNVSTSSSKVIASLALFFGGLIGLMAVVFLVDVLDVQPFHALRRQVDESEVARQDTILRAQERQSWQDIKQFEQSFNQPRYHQSDTSEPNWVRHDSVISLHDREILPEQEW